ncbi:MAG: monofunctional biosynthetic peptidoglycan transglycosylase [Prevotellaceae bacterium]|jgi:monofunctional biosynthetic peptidoglycan transglycosylase|nr:monofunctional biosynthetic peptidoglycan transglycosylase [Prevotellaceae bacterium]
MAKTKKTAKKTAKKTSGKLWSTIRKFMLRAFIFFVLYSILSVVLFRWLPVRYTPLMFIRYIENIDNGDYRNVRKWKSLDEISGYMVTAVIASEDNMFLSHCGIDWDAMKKAMNQNRVRGTKIGASTITQQTAKNVYLSPSRTWMRKGFEAYFAILIEFFWSKRRIMEVYLNIIEVGDGLYGVESAAQKYFKKPASKLTAYEAAQIASILPNPRIFNIKNPSRELITKQNKIRNQMRRMTTPTWE